MAVAVGFKNACFSHATPEEIAEHAKCKTRYVKEWLAIMSSADIIEVDSDDKYWVRADDVEACLHNIASILWIQVLLKRELHNSPSACLINTEVYPKLVECIKEGGPRGILVIYRIIPGLGLFSKDYNWYKNDLDDPCDHLQFLGDVRRICEASLNEELFVLLFFSLFMFLVQVRLKKGDQMVLEVGCGSGAHSAVFASLFPNNQYTGIDIDSSAIRVAHQRR